MSKRKETSAPRPRSKVNTQQTGLPRQLGCVVIFPARVWVPAFADGWTSRAVTAADIVERKRVAELLGAAL